MQCGVPADTDGMPVRLHHVLVDAHDLPGLARFRAQALGWKVLSERAREIVIGTDENASAGMCFMPVTDPKTVRTACTSTWRAARRTANRRLSGCSRWGAPGRHRVDRRRVLNYPGRPRGERVLRDTSEGNAHRVRLNAGRHRPALSAACEYAPAIFIMVRCMSGVRHARFWPELESAEFAGLPDFFAWPLPRPFQGRQRISCGSTWPGPELEGILDFQAAAAKQPDHVAVAEVEFHRLIIPPRRSFYGGHPVYWRKSSCPPGRYRAAHALGGPGQLR
jgi:hypothetical protein